MIADYSACIDLAPEHFRAWSNRGAAWQCLGDHDRAVADYTAAIRLQPSHSASHHSRGVSREQLDQWEDAISDFTRALQLDETQAASNVARGRLYDRMGDHESAVADFSSALAKLAPSDDSDRAELPHCRGLAHRNAGDLQAAVDDYTSALQLDPVSTAATAILSNRGWALRKLGKKLGLFAEKAKASGDSASKVEDDSMDEHVGSNDHLNIHASPLSTAVLHFL